MRKSDEPIVRAHADESAPARESFEVTIERILPGGLGLAHADGRTLMVALSAPGDHLRVRIDRVKGGVAFASIVEILESSPVRVEAPCPYFGRCGGCDFQQLNYQAQLDAKVAIIRDCLHRIARIEQVPEIEIVPAPNQWHYRARAQWQYDSVRRRLGYFEANSHRVCDVAECAVLVPELQRELESLREQMKQGELAHRARYFRAVVGDERVAIAPIVGSASEGASYRTASGSERVKDSTEPDGRKPIFENWCDPIEITRTIHGERYHLSADSFFQTNVDLLPQLIDYALGDVRGGTAVELYCGVGLFTLPLARQFGMVIAVEDDADATRFARQNLLNASLANAEVVNEDVGDWLQDEKRRQAHALQAPDFLLLDPPRTGAESRVISGILDLKPKRICYVSCDPATLARDLKKLIAGGYRIESIRAFDMFPQTHHVETIVHMT